MHLVMKHRRTSSPVADSNHACKSYPPNAQVKVLRDPSKKDKSGNPQCKGIAFAEFKDHEHALCALRQLNNNPAPFGAQFPQDSRSVPGCSVKDSSVP